MRLFLKTNKWLLSVYLVLIGIGGYYVWQQDKVSLHYQMNQVVGHAFWDSFFYYITYLGDGTIAAIFIALILVLNVRMGLALLICFALAGLVTYAIKQIGYDEVNRPSFVFHFFVKGKTLNYVEGVDLHIHNSFPSGHATQAFAVFGLLAFFLKQQWQKLVCIFIAILTAYSRVYLSQHWLIDILGGSLVGFTAAVFIYFSFSLIKKTERLNRPIWQLNYANTPS